MTKLTSDTAFNVIFQMYIKPPMFITIITAFIKTTKEQKMSRPDTNVVTKNTAKSE